jgi:hypothetical protein
MRNPFRHNHREEAATRTATPERRGYEGEGQRYEEGDAPARRHGPAAAEPGPGGERRAEGPRRGWGWRGRNAGAATVGAVGGGVLMLARLVMSVAVLIGLLIALSIVLFDIGANSSNTIVEGIHEGANFFAGAFTGLITFSGKPKLELSVDWAIAIFAYLAVGAVIASLIRSIGAAGVRFEERHRPAL